MLIFAAHRVVDLDIDLLPHLGEGSLAHDGPGGSREQMIPRIKVLAVCLQHRIKRILDGQRPEAGLGLWILDLRLVLHQFRCLHDRDRLFLEVDVFPLQCDNLAPAAAGVEGQIHESLFPLREFRLLDRVQFLFCERTFFRGVALDGRKISLPQILQNAVKLCEGTKAFRGFQILIAVHRDRKHKHAHIIVNSVSMEDGHKLQWSRQDLWEMKERCNNLSLEQGLSVPISGRHYDGRENTDVTTWDKDKQKVYEKAFSGMGKSYIVDIANAVANVRAVAESREHFISMMKERGYLTEWKDSRKHITFTDIARMKEGEAKCKVRNTKLTKDFKVDFGKEGLEYEFSANAKRSRAAGEAREQLDRVNAGIVGRGTEDDYRKAVGEDPDAGARELLAAVSQSADAVRDDGRKKADRGTDRPGEGIERSGREIPQPQTADRCEDIGAFGRFEEKGRSI